MDQDLYREVHVLGVMERGGLIDRLDRRAEMPLPCPDKLGETLVSAHKPRATARVGNVIIIVGGCYKIVWEIAGTSRAEGVRKGRNLSKVTLQKTTP